MSGSFFILRNKELEMKKVELFPYWKEIVADLETPVSAFLKLRGLGAKFLLESVEKGEKLGRYSFIGLNPLSTIRIDEGKIFVDGSRVNSEPQEFLEKLRRVVFSYEVLPKPELSPLIGGWVGYLGYDIVRFFEPVKLDLSDGLPLPEGVLSLMRDIVVFDHITHSVKIITLTDRREASEAVFKRIEGIKTALNRFLDLRGKLRKREKSKRPKGNISQGDFEGLVKKAKEYILAGDVFQVVLSQRFTGETSAPPFEIYRALRTINPSPYMFFLDFDDFQLIGSSPEALAKLRGGIASVHPIAGTRPRGKTPEEEKELEKELFQSEKEIAEHVMLVDLARNDLGKVCLPHSIEVKERMKLEKYSHVMHIVSEVIGRIDPRFDALDLFRAAFPAGTVTGAPKIRAMEIIEELEGMRRGPYAGALGYFGLDGNMDMCIAIRMIVYQQGRYYLQAGAGIVADSDPSAEYWETLNKMEGLYQAIKLSEGEDDLTNR